MNKSIRWLVLVSMLVLLLAACGPTPEPQVIKETVVVQETVEVVVQETVEVPQVVKETVVVEKEVEVEVTPEPCVTLPSPPPLTIWKTWTR
jgi:uncharacterized protein YcfL